VAVVRLPRIANFDDFDPLSGEPDVRLRFVERGADLGRPDLLILPGTKATIADLAWLRATGMAERVASLARAGTAVIGICGGYQMLGCEIRDRGHVESSEDAVPGLGLLPVTTDFEPVKATHRVEASVLHSGGLLAGCAGLPVRGYEIHMGQSTAGGGTEAPFRLLRRSGRSCGLHDGAVRPEGWVLGTYLHGLFDNHALRAAMLENLARRKGVVFRPGVPLARASEYDRLADCLRSELDLDVLRTIIGLETRTWAS
jgi:adenosylcobyric acid synthase